MMTVPMDKAPMALAERLYKKNIDLEAKLRKFAKLKVPSDPNLWFQIRENYEAIILEDYDFCEKHDIGLALWQLHYRRIEEFRALLNVARSAGSVNSQGGRTLSRPDSVMKIRSGFKTFLSESSGFYHDLILKIKEKFGLPLGFLPAGPESQTTLTKDEKKSVVMKKGIISCHRSLIYLGDLSRYKGLYGEGDSVSREYAAASSYYNQAAFLCPSSGNPHHQLAILASYSGDDLLSIYRYFRSLAADIPFPTARDNLIIAFEKNRQILSQLPGNLQPVAAKTTAARTPVKGRGGAEVLKAFSTRFIRVNGILFTRTSLETFGEIFSSVKSDLLDLLSSGSEEMLNFGQGATDNGLFVVRLMAILIFTVHNVIKESDNQSYAEILQHTELLQDAFTAAFEFAGHMIKRCMQLHDTASSFLLPAISVFIQWLASQSNIAAGSSAEEKGARSFFWNQFVAFMNKLISSGFVFENGDKDETCFSSISQYDEGETGNIPALWEDFELKGFLPLVPAQLVLDFSKKHSCGSDESEKERQARVQKILAAGKSLVNVVQIDQMTLYFDPRLKIFVIGNKPSILDDYMCAGLSDVPKLHVANQASDYSMMQSSAQLCADGEDDEEEIVFKPIVGKKYPSVTATNPMSNAYEIVHPEQVSSEGEWAVTSMSTAYETIQPAQLSSSTGIPYYGTPVSMSLSNFQMSNGLHTSSPLGVSAADFAQQSPQHMNLNTSKWLMEKAALLSKGLKNSSINKNELPFNHGSLEGQCSLQAATLISSSPIEPLTRSSGQAKVAEAFAPSKLDSVLPAGMTFDGLTVDPDTPRKTPVSRPVSHLGPPPGFSMGPPAGFSMGPPGFSICPSGFNNIPSKLLDDSRLESAMNGENPQIDDYRWLDGYQPTKSASMGTSFGAMSFPFPGKQVSTMQTQVVTEKWQNSQLFDHRMPNSEQQLQQASFQPSMMPEHQVQPLWSGFFV